jgi:hypothetical protein
VASKCVEYLAELARHNYVTPKSYLELLNIFSILIGQKKMELKTAKNRMKSGLDKVGLRKARGQWLATWAASQQSLMSGWPGISNCTAQSAEKGDFLLSEKIKIISEG